MSSDQSPKLAQDYIHQSKRASKSNDAIQEGLTAATERSLEMSALTGVKIKNPVFYIPYAALPQTSTGRCHTYLFPMMDAGHEFAVDYKGTYYLVGRDELTNLSNLKSAENAHKASAVEKKTRATTISNHFKGERDMGVASAMKNAKKGALADLKKCIKKRPRDDDEEEPYGGENPHSDGGEEEEEEEEPYDGAPAPTKTNTPGEGVLPVPDVPNVPGISERPRRPY